MLATAEWFPRSSGRQRPARRVSAGATDRMPTASAGHTGVPGPPSRPVDAERPTAPHREKRRSTRTQAPVAHRLAGPSLPVRDGRTRHGAARPETRDAARVRGHPVAPARRGPPPQATRARRAPAWKKPRPHRRYPSPPGRRQAGKRSARDPGPPPRGPGRAHERRREEPRRVPRPTADEAGGGIRAGHAGDRWPPCSWDSRR